MSKNQMCAIFIHNPSPFGENKLTFRRFFLAILRSVCFTRWLWMMHLVAVGAVRAVEFCALMSPYPLVCEPVLWYNDGDMMNILAAGVHQLDPVLLEVPGTPLAIRWYGLAYLAGFVLGYYVLLQLSKKKLYVVEPDKLSDFVAMQVCLIGVVCGGVVYYIIYNFVILLGLKTDYLKMLSAVIVATFLAVPYLKAEYFTKHKPLPIAKQEGGGNDA